MTCRHSYGDPGCSSYQSQLKKAQALVNKSKSATTPDSQNYEVIDAHREGTHLVLKVKYPNCAKCSYEGTKVMVFLNVTEKDIIMWNQIDPHFGDPKEKRTKNQAPSPAARFPASDEGWKDAIAYVVRKRPSAKRSNVMSNHICTADDCCTYEERQERRNSRQ